MKILFYDTKSYDKDSFEAAVQKLDSTEIEIEFIKSDLDPRTAALAEGCDAVCAFVSSNVGAKTLDILHNKGVRLVLMRCAGFNNVDLIKAEECGIRIMRVPGYSPEAVAEHAIALALACNRRLYKAYNKVRENDFSLSGLMGINFNGKTAGIIGTGKIGAAMCRICRGFGMKVIAYDVYQNPALKDFVEYVSLDELLAQSDLISLHCPLTPETHHLINRETLALMKPTAFLINTSRGALVEEEALIEALRSHKLAGAGLDVQEQEPPRADNPLYTLENVILTPHMGWKGLETRQRLVRLLAENISAYLSGHPIHVVE